VVALPAPPNKTDVFVVGGGPAGLAAAIAARQKGFNVAVADVARPPIDKACGEGLMPESLAALSALGVTVESGQCLDFRGVRFVEGRVSVEANFPDKSGIGIRRTCLHRLLVDRASDLGVSLLWGTRVTGLSKDRVSVDGNTIQCRWLVGADGQKSRVRAWAGLDRARHESIRYGFRRHYQMPPWTDHVEVHWGTGCQVYVTPVGPLEVSVALLSSDARVRLDGALSQFPDLSRRLADAAISSSERGAVTASRCLHKVVQGNTLLIGDASGSVDAITGEGLCLSFRQALALADALSSGDPDSYQAEHRRLAQRPMFMSRMLLSLDRFPKLRRRVLRTLEARPAVFEKLLAIHVGTAGQCPPTSNRPVLGLPATTRLFPGDAI
jgi:flavin-dependent dehydrogenase